MDKLKLSGPYRSATLAEAPIEDGLTCRQLLPSGSLPIPPMHSRLYCYLPKDRKLSQKPPSVALAYSPVREDLADPDHPSRDPALRKR